MVLSGMPARDMLVRHVRLIECVEAHVDADALEGFGEDVVGADAADVVARVVC